MSQVLRRHMPRLGSSLLVSCLWSFAVAGVFEGGLFEAAFRQLASSLPPDRARPLLLLQLLQASTLLQVGSERQQTGLAARRVPGASCIAHTRGGCHAQDGFSTAGLPPPAWLPPGLLAAARRQWLFSNRRSPGRRSNLQADVCAVLARQLGLAVSQERLTDDGLFSIDIAVAWKGRCGRRSSAAGTV